MQAGSSPRTWIRWSIASGSIKPGTDPDAGGIDLLLPANELLSVIIRKNDEFNYSVMPTNSVSTMTGKGGGPITN
jgi:hypothetical protein